MTFEAERAKLVRTPCDLVIITLDYCENTYGTGACTATASDKCYNTFRTCKDKANYSKTTKQYRFTSSSCVVPFKTGERPYIEKITPFATEIKNDNITVNARVKVSMLDEPDTDIGIDPYVTDRSLVQGTFWKKLIARNPHYKGRLFEWYEGYVGLAEEEYQRRFVGLLDNVTISKGKVTLEAVDLLKELADITVPAEIDCKLTTDISDSDTTITVNSVDDLDSSGYVRIGDEIIAYTGISTLQLTGCTRAQFGTTAESHDTDDALQPCRYYVKQNPFDTLLEMLETDAGISSTYLDSASFSDVKAWPGGEQDVWAIVSEPMPLEALFFELLDLVDCKIWVAEDLKITIARNIPNRGGRTYADITDGENIIDGSPSVDLNEESRITRVVMYWDKDAIGDLEKQSSYNRLDIAIDADAEGGNEYNEEIKKETWCRWIHPDSGTEEDLALWISGMLARYVRNRRDAAHQISLEVEEKDSGIKTGGYVLLSTDELAGFDGSDLNAERFRVIKREPKGNGRVQYKLERMPQRRVCIIAPESQADYSSATQAEKEYGYISDANGEMSTGEKGYYIH